MGYSEAACGALCLPAAREPSHAVYHPRHAPFPQDVGGNPNTRAVHSVHMVDNPGT